MCFFASSWCLISYNLVQIGLSQDAVIKLQSQLAQDWFTLGLTSEISYSFDHVDYFGYEEQLFGQCGAEDAPGKRIALSVTFKLDEDGDGIIDADDSCPGTSSDVLENELKPNHFIFGPDDFVKGETKGNGEGTDKSFNIEQTHGCSCAQIIEQLGLGNGHRKSGCSPGVMDCWVNGNCDDDTRKLRG